MQEANFIKFGTNKDAALSIQQLITQNINNINTAFLAKIISINGNKLGVQAIAKKTIKTKNPIINNVLIAQPKSGEWEISFKLKVGDIGLCVVCDSDISLYKQTGNTDFLVNSNQRFNIKDSVFFPLSLITQTSSDFKISNNKGDLIEFNNGELTINANSNVNIQGELLALKSSQTTLKNELEALLDILIKYNLLSAAKADLIAFKANNLPKLFKE